MRVGGLINIFLLSLISLLLVLISFFSVIHRSFKDTPSILNFFKQAKIYDNVSEIVKYEIVSHYQQEYPSSIIQTAVFDTVVDYLVTPGLIEKIAEPALTVSMEFVKQPTSIVDNQIVVDTTKYKAQIMDLVVNFGFSSSVNSIIDNLFSSFPKQIVLMDTSSSYLLTTIIKIKTLVQYNRAFLQISWIVFLVLLIVLTIINIRSIKHLIFIIFLILIISGLLNILIFFLIPSIIYAMMPTDYNQISLLQNKLVSDAVYYVFSEIKNIGIIYIVLAALSFLIFKYKNFDRLQNSVDRGITKIKKVSS